MRRTLAGAAVSLMLLATACSGESEPELIEPSLGHSASTGLLEVDFRYGKRTSMYAEGARHYLEVRDADGGVILRRDEGTEQGPGAGYSDSIRLEPGRYRVQTFQRGCDFTEGRDCESTLAPRKHRCTADVVLPGGGRTRVTIKVSLPKRRMVEVSRR